MSGDYSRIRFDPYLDINGVLMQQGRVQLDSDWNESVTALDRRMRAENIDTFGVYSPPGTCVAVVSPQTPDAFKIKASAGKITIGRGRMYVDGLLAENHGDIEAGEAFDPVLAELRGQDLLPYEKQPYLQNPPALPGGSGINKYVGTGGPHLAYLEIWQREATCHQLPGIMEQAVGVDTTTRLQTVWQVRLLADVGDADCGTPDNQIENWQKLTQPSVGRLSVKTVEAKDDKGPCELPLGGGYRGLENQLYRIEIHDGGKMGAATFKWSRENASVESDVVKIVSSTQLKLSSLGRDTVLRFNKGDWVEVLDDWRELGGENGDPKKRRGEMRKIKDIFENLLTIELETALPEELVKLDDPIQRRTRVRRWDQKDGDIVFLFNDNGDKIEPSAAVENGLIKVPTDKGVWMALENGIQVRFDLDAADGEFRCGDYWVSAARTANTSVEKLTKAPPRGIHRHYTQLSIINFPNAETDCRVLWPPFFGGCCTYTVGDGIKSRGHFKSIQAAVDALPPEGGKVCVLPGTHFANVQLHAPHNSNIHISGCGLQTLIFPEDERDGEAIFHINGGTGIQLCDLTLVTVNGVAIEIMDSNKASHEISIMNNAIIACTHAINLNCISNDSFLHMHKDTGTSLPFTKKQESATNAVRIIGNKIAMLNKSTGEAAIFTAADDVLIEDNLIIVVPFLSTRQNEALAQNPIQVHSLLVYAKTVRETQLLHDINGDYLASGGIQIAGGSEFVAIRRNRIVGGSGNGVTLGNITSQDNQKYPLFISELDTGQRHDIEPYTIALIYDVTIEENSISAMGLSGIGLPSIFKFGIIDLMLSIDGLGIYRNRIENCLLQLPKEIPDWTGIGSIVLMACENAQIQGNKIENNGAGQPKAICGILIFYGEKIDISGNRILNNGPQSIVSPEGEKKYSQLGLRGGIVILWGFGRAFSVDNLIDSVASMAADYQKQMYSDGIPAIKIHDNIITQPLGQALVLTALGPVSVTGNHLTSQGADFMANISSALAGSVFILNLGVSKDLMLFALLASFKEAARFSTTTEYATLVGKKTRDYPWLKYLYFPSGNVMFSNNQVLLDLRNLEPNFSFSSQLIASLDDVAYCNNQSECASLKDFLFTDVAIVSITQRCSDNRFQEGFTFAFFSLFSFGFMNLAIGNQATHCLLVIGGDDMITAKVNNVLLSAGCAAREFAIMRRLGKQTAKLMTDSPNLNLQ